MPEAILVIVIGIASAASLAAGGLWFLAAQSRTRVPDYVGPGNLASGTGKPNYVSSLSVEPARKVDSFSFEGDPDEAWKTAERAIQSLPKTRVIRRDDDYLHAEAATPLFGFVDDLELQRDAEAKVIHVRSASRVGHSDMGANAKRVEALRKAFQTGKEGS